MIIQRFHNNIHVELYYRGRRNLGPRPLASIRPQYRRQTIDVDENWPKTSESMLISQLLMVWDIYISAFSLTVGMWNLLDQ